MYLDALVSQAKESCQRFLEAAPSYTREVAAVELASLLKQLSKVMVAIIWTSSMSQSMRPSMLLYSYVTDFHEGAISGEKKVSYYLFPTGVIVRQALLTCPSGCHSFGEEAQDVDLAYLLSETKAEQVVRGVMPFLEDPKGDLLEFVPSVLN